MVNLNSAVSLSYRKSGDQRVAFCVRYAEMTSSPMSLLEEGVRLAQRLYDSSMGKPMMVALSGGADSEIVLRSFVSAKVPVKAAIMSFKNGLNSHDTAIAKSICEELDIPVVHFELDLFDFYERNEHLKMAEKYGLTSPQIATHLWLAQQIITQHQAVPVFSGDLLRFEIDPGFSLPCYETLNSWTHSGYIKIRDHLPIGAQPVFNGFIMEKLFKDLNTRGISNFLLMSPEMTSEALRLSLEIDLAEKLRLAKLYSEKSFDGVSLYQTYYFENLFKTQIYSKGGFQIKSRPYKFTGFELVHSFMAGADMDNENLIHCGFQQRFEGLIKFNEKFRAPMRGKKQPHLMLELYLPKEFLNYAIHPKGLQ